MEQKKFESRADAGRQLAELLRPYELDRPLVLALPRGGVPVAAEVARALVAPLDTVVARKIGAPSNPEYGLGAVAMPGVLVLDREAMAAQGIEESELASTIERERAEVARRAERYRSGSYGHAHDGNTVILVDDGLATGVTARAAIESVRKERRPKKLVFAAPVCAADALPAVRALADEVVCVSVVDDLGAIALWYDDFEQVSDEEVARLLDGQGAV